VNRRAVALAVILVLIAWAQPFGNTSAQSSVAGPTSQQLYAFTQYPIPQNSSQPGAIAIDRSGNLWFVEQGLNEIGSFNPSAKSFSSYAIPTTGALPQGISVDAQGNVWFSELGPNKLGELQSGRSAITEVDIPPGPEGLGCGPIGVTPHAGAIWFTCEFSNQIDEYTPTAGTFNQFDLPLLFSAPLQIVFDSSGNFWFTASDVGMIGHATVGQLQAGTSNGIDEFAPINSTYVTTIANQLLPGGSVMTSLNLPSQIALSPDGSSLWVTEHGASSFDHYEIGTRSLVKYFTSASMTPAYPDSLPNGISLDSLGNIWITEHGANRIAEYSPSTNSMVEFPVPCCGKGLAGVLYLTVGAAGAVWFTEFFGNAIGELSPTNGAAPAALTLSPGSIEVGSTGSAALSVEVSVGGTGQPAGGQYSFWASGVTPDGSLRNVTADFAPATLTLVAGSGASANLTITASGLKPGVYYLTVGAASSSTGVISSRFLVLTVTQGNQLLLPEIAATAAILSVAVALLALRRMRTK
jgi:streptogramin lyase